MDRAGHWNAVYSRKKEDEVSWFEASPEISLRLLEHAGLDRSPCVLDVGGGESHLVDALLARGLTCITVLDVSRAALTRAQGRLGAAASIPVWIEADVTGEWIVPPVDIWHDRAVFHFLTEADERRRYRDHLETTVTPGGSAVIATFASDGPPACSGLPVVRYSPAALAAELGGAFDLAESVLHRHRTPWGAEQSFQYSRLVRRG